MHSLRQTRRVREILKLRDSRNAKCHVGPTNVLKITSGDRKNEAWNWKMKEVVAVPLYFHFITRTSTNNIVGILYGYCDQSWTTPSDWDYTGCCCRIKLNCFLFLREVECKVSKEWFLLNSLSNFKMNNFIIWMENYKGVSCFLIGMYW